MSRLVVRMRRAGWIAATFDGWIAVAITLVVYGLTELIGADAIYPTVDDALAAFRSQPSPNGAP